MMDTVAETLGQVFRNWRYVLLALASAVVIFVLTTWLPNIFLVWQVTSSDAIAVSSKQRILAALVGSIATNFTFVSALMAIVIALLFGINAALLIYGWRQRSATRLGLRAQTGLAGVAGLASGLFGIGCAACGSYALAPVLGLLGAGSLVAALPFGGGEFSFLGLALLVLAFLLLTKSIATNAACTAPIHEKSP